MAKTNTLHRVTIIYPSGQIVITTEPNPNYERLSRAVGGYIETIPDFGKYNGIRVNAAYCNKEGKLRGLDFNHEATTAWQDYLASTGREFYPSMATLAGPVIIIQSIPKGGV